MGSVADVGGGAYGKVDTNRKVGVNQIADTNMTGLALAITQEPARPQYAAIVALSDAPSSFLEVFTQPGGKNAVPNANFQLDTGNNVDQAGIYFGNSVSNPVAIVAVPDITRTVYSDVAILDYAANADNLIYVIDITESLTALTASATVATGQSAMGVTAAGVESGIQRWDLGFPANGRNPNSVAFTMYEPFQGDMDFGFVTGNPISGYPDYQGFFISAPIYLTVVKGVVTNSFGGGSFADTPFKVAGYFFNAGNGGNSESGAGGAGGSLGATLTINGTGSTATGTGSLSVEFPTNQDYEGNVYFNAGNGGNGFNNAGNGGNIIGVSVTYPTPVQTGAALLTAGTGGQSLTGTGGAGGSLSQLFIQSGEYFQAGDGGVGVVGGSGGSLLGNTQPGLITANTSNVDPYITLVGGNGATGILGGGNGGGINSFVNQFDALVFGTGGSLSYTAGNAGNAVAGHGGAGGSIINSSPDSTDNNLVGDIYLYGGQGGSGLYGGAGGSITNFAQVSTINESPTAFAVFAGFGGNATIGSGGAGGNITGISIAASGTGGGGVLGALHYNRLVAGAGGASAGGTGGSGGSIGGYGSGEAVNTTSVAAGTQNVDAAGAGGAGLSAGGNGGNVINVQADAAASAANSTGKVVIIAGDGGESTGALPAKGANATETARNIANAVGGVNGPGGNGGSIINFTQATSIYTNVDLIAGNGGATINHSVAAGNAAVDNSGEGGSVGNIAVQGSIGDCAAGVAIRSYNNFFAGQTMQEFVDSYIIGDISGVMDDAVGNVGLVAGAAGRVEGGLPSTDGINGSVNNIIATNIMSMVAGNVDQVDFIQNLTNYKTYGSGGFGSGILGANKTASSLPGFTGILGGLNYINAAGTLVNTPIPGGGALLDGAFMAKNERQPSGVRDFIGTTG